MHDPSTGPGPSARVRALLNPAIGGGSLTHGVLWSLVVSAIGVLLSYALHIGLARTLGSVDYGRYTYAMGWMNLAQLVISFELGITALRFVGAYRASGSWGLLRGLLERSREFILIAWLGSLVLVVAAAALFDFRLDPDVRRALFAALLVLPVAALLQLEGKFLQAFGRPLDARIPYDVVRPALVLGLIATAAAFFEDIPATWAIAANGVGALVALAASVIRLRAAQPPVFRAARAEYDTRTWLRTAGSLFVVSIFQMLISQQSDVVVVGLLRDPTKAGMYAAASQLAMMVGLVASVSGDVAAASIAARWAVQDWTGLRRIVQRMVLINMLVAVPIVLILITAGFSLLRIYGLAFTLAYPVLVRLAFAQLIGAMFGGLGGVVLAMTGKQNIAAPFIIGAGILNLLLALWWTPRYGMQGTADATLVAAAVRALFVLWLVRKHTGLIIRPGF